jgi:cation:H+ antiporter
MIIQILLLIGGLALILFGANWLVDGSTSIARKTGLSEFVIGLTIVGIGTSAPEMVVSYISAFQGKSDMAIGNVIGSNIFNVFMILGITALIAPLTITKSNAKRDIPLNIGVTALLILLGLKNTIFGIGSDVISRWEGALLLGIFIVYLWRSFANGAATEEESDEESRSYSTGMSILMILGGLGALVGGGRLFVNSATAIAEQLHMSEKLIAITIMSAGTSLPELATCIVAARKGKGQMALGNIIGSNISNILLILGGAALIHPMSFAGISMVDTAVVSASAILLLISVFSFRKGYIDRAEGAFFVLIQISYMIWLIING